MKEYCIPGEIATPSLVQLTAGVGTPLTGHLMVMVMFEAAVKLSPMFIVTGLPSPTGISFPVSETSMVGLTGSANKFSHILNIHFERQLCLYITFPSAPIEAL